MAAKKRRARAKTEWVTFTRRTEDPKLCYLEQRLDEEGIKHRRRGHSFHAPILEVPKNRLDDAWKRVLTSRIDEMADDAPMFRRVCSRRFGF